MAKSFKVGNLQKKKDGSGYTIKLGNYNKNEKFATSTGITVLDASGNVLTKQKDCFLVLKDPRKNEKLTEEQIAKIPEFIEQEVFLVVSD